MNQRPTSNRTADKSAANNSLPQQNYLSNDQPNSQPTNQQPTSNQTAGKSADNGESTTTKPTANESTDCKPTSPVTTHQAFHFLVPTILGSLLDFASRSSKGNSGATSTQQQKEQQSNDQHHSNIIKITNHIQYGLI